MKTPLQYWLNTMKQIWLNKTPDKIAGILSENLVYYESPLEPPLTTIEKVVSVWQEIKCQDIEFVEMEILYETNNIGMVTWTFKEIGKSLHVGSYYIELDNEGKCKHFRQWWNS